MSAGQNADADFFNHRGLEPPQRLVRIFEALSPEVQMTLLHLGGVEAVEVEIVREPPWHPGMMSESGRKHIGFVAS